jgi:hypothetical protein
MWLRRPLFLLLWTVRAVDGYTKKRPVSLRLTTPEPTAKALPFPIIKHYRSALRLVGINSFVAFLSGCLRILRFEELSWNDVDNLRKESYNHFKIQYII